jgi:hypothetical protein
MEAVYLICFIGAGCVSGLAARTGRPGSGFPFAGTFVVALMAVVGYNSRWVGATPPKPALFLVALLAGGLAWLGVRFASSRWSPSWAIRVGATPDRQPPKSISQIPVGDVKASSPGLPVTSPGFGDVSLREVMTPKTMIVGIEWEATATDAVKAVSSSGHSRLAVYQEDLDHIVGVVQEVLRHVRGVPA